MAEFKKPWNDGGSLSVAYTGDRDGSAVFSSDPYEGIDRVQSVVFRDAGQTIAIEKLVRQDGIRQQFVTSDGKVFKVTQGRYGVLKEAVDTSINIENYLTIEALADGLTAKLASDAVEYCVDGDGVWKTLEAGVATEAINTGQTLSFRANYKSYNTSRRFTITKSCNVLGDPMSLYYGDGAKNYDTLPYNYSFAYLFYRITTIVDASKLVLDRKLKNYAYYYMFQGCTALKYPPELPATTLSSSCYRRMFQGCKALLISPKLPALTLVSNCYEYMLTSCSKCKEITMLATSISASNCLLGWVNAISNSGTFYKNKDATWTTTGISGVPSGWTVILI